ncbi:hypothetical protein UFOVP1288_78 [uncultured Caudovirales phage]|uniref:Uncharacterized protein n=1 Tax=uncultured Caudovirales phage TaxID=2100421 RepID=A0A6J5R853_9CAUD|nr:hypothetical protein UFOVP1195_78 [uncultured Caudovirales phage]CAB4196334.1 hypothetical protein UFOVP1288_78 [uncultured Caudovirales phage]CAB4205235.1 hypothetical protein UFOVP1409_78 [uncultured Caudovirales phage]
MKTLLKKLQRKLRWGTPVGRDCISLHTSLCAWLGARLVFLSAHSHGHPYSHSQEAWEEALLTHGQALLAWSTYYEKENYEEELYHEAQRALHWVARHLGKLWD